jgi:hypothetical protein
VYTVAGVIELQFADYIYGGEERRVDFVRDMTIPEESTQLLQGAELGQPHPSGKSGTVDDGIR